jgi:membrane peptidoglycan carboxypeptidase
MLLGTNYISPLTMATAYAAFGNNGVVCTPIAIDKVVAANGTDVPVPKSTCTQGLPANITAGIDYALQRVMTNGTATTANPRDGVPILGKTGTTDYAHDNWLVTSTTKVATATWIGNIQGVPDARGVSRKADMHNVYFRAKGGGPAIRGNNVKFSVAKPILAALNAVYGGAAFPEPDNSLLYGSHSYSGPSGPSKSNPPTAPAAPAAPAVLNSGNPANVAPSGPGRGKGAGKGRGGGHGG